MGAVRDHFFVMIGDICANARLAGLPVVAVTGEGRRVWGIPRPRTVGSSPDPQEVEGTGFARDLVIGDETVALDAVVELRIRLPVTSATV
jgi:hypothetical protein